MPHTETMSTQATPPGADTLPPEPSAGTQRGVLDHLWSDWRFGAAAASALAVVFGLASAWLTPRGPVTGTEALATMVAALIVGLGAGLVMGSRWSMLVAPVVFAVAFEVARMGIDGPTVDGIRLGSLYGIIAFVTGRLVNGLLVFGPMILGARLGVAGAARLGDSRAPVPGAGGWTGTALLALVVGAVAISIARPASTAPILGPDGEPLPGSIAELVAVEIGGHDQVLMIRGRSIDNPVLLYLAGGPGGTDLGAVRADVGLEEDFVVVAWDQRGTGKSYAALDPTETLTLDRMVADTLEVTEYLRDRFDEERIYLVGNSWGSTLGVLASQQRPDLFHAFVGTGQMVSQRETDIMFWEDTLRWAEETGNEGLVETLAENGPPPYEDVTKYEPGLSHEHDWNPYAELDLDNEMPAILFVPEYTWMDRVNAFRGFLDTASVLYPQLQDLDFRIDVPTLEVPFVMVLGEHEARGRAVLANEWFDMVDAPFKERVVVDGAGHRVQFDRPEAFAHVMEDLAASTVPAAVANDG